MTQDHQTWSDPTAQKTPSSCEEGQSGSSTNDEFQLTCFAKGGIGLSLVTRDPPEEILYMFMSNVVIDYQVSAKQTILDGSVQNIQIDNQLADAQMPVVLYLTPTPKTDA